MHGVKHTLIYLRRLGVALGVFATSFSCFKLVTPDCGVHPAPTFLSKNSDDKQNLSKPEPFVACWILRSESHEDLHKIEAIIRNWGKHCGVLEFIDRNTSGVTDDWIEDTITISAKRVFVLGTTCTPSIFPSGGSNFVKEVDFFVNRYGYLYHPG